MSETIIELKNLSIGYGNKKVLQNVNTKINIGEIVGIIGCNGAGKVHFLKLYAVCCLNKVVRFCILVVIWKAFQKKNLQGNCLFATKCKSWVWLYW